MNSEEIEVYEVTDKRIQNSLFKKIQKLNNIHILKIK
jgi:hypothetical protein